jgi:hypothetical protein
VDFSSVWSGLGPNHNYFLETEGPAAIFQSHRDRGLNYNNLRGLFTKRQGIWIFLDLISNGKIHGPGPQRCGPVARPGPRWTSSGLDERCGGALSTLGRLRSPVLTGSGCGAQGRQGRAGEGLTRARVVVGWRRDGGKERWWLELSARVEEGERELRSEGERCGVLWFWCSPFIEASGCRGRGNGR